jgi:hypothetical protein
MCPGCYRIELKRVRCISFYLWRLALEKSELFFVSLVTLVIRRSDLDPHVIALKIVCPKVKVINLKYDSVFNQKADRCVRK